MAERILTKDLKIITDRHDRTLDIHEGRIKKLEKVQDDHIQRHEDVYDPALQKHEILLVGERGDNGMVLANKEIQIALKSINEKLDKKEDNNKWLTRLIAGTLITSILTAVMTLIMK